MSRKLIWTALGGVVVGSVVTGFVLRQVVQPVVPLPPAPVVQTISYTPAPENPVERRLWEVPQGQGADWALAPEDRPLPPGWTRQMFNGLPVYTILLAHETASQRGTVGNATISGWVPESTTTVWEPGSVP